MLESSEVRSMIHRASLITGDVLQGLLLLYFWRQTPGRARKLLLVGCGLTVVFSDLLWK